MLIYHSANPRALKGFSDFVLWQSNPKAWVIGGLLDSLVIYWSPFVNEYCAKNNLTNKILLIVDNTPGHPVNKDLVHKRRVVFLPPNTTSLIQPMDQCVNTTFKAYYLQCVMEPLISETDGEAKPTICELCEFWKTCNIKKAVDNNGTSWDEVTMATMNGVWCNLWPECVKDFGGFEKVNVVQRHTVSLAKEAGFEVIDKDDVEELLASPKEELTNGELLMLTKENTLEKEDRAILIGNKATCYKTIYQQFYLVN